MTATSQPVRHLSAADLDLPLPAAATPPPLPPGVSEPIEPLEPDDPVLETTEELLTNWGGVIYVGPPGTSKTWYAHRVALTLTGSLDRVRLVQFHPSYQYEDFVEGFVPLEEGGFKLRPKHFLDLCKLAAENPDERVVLVIDELSRGDPGRVFGEALTYIEKSKRGLHFQLASGTPCSVPANLIVLATMNPLDRGVDEVDAALERRFAKYALDPDSEAVLRFLTDAGMEEGLRNRVISFFNRVNHRNTGNPFAALGHTYFVGVSDEVGLRRLWEHQLRFHFDGAYRLDAAGRSAIDRLWDDVLEVAPLLAPETAEPKMGTP